MTFYTLYNQIRRFKSDKEELEISELFGRREVRGRIIDVRTSNEAFISLIPKIYSKAFYLMKKKPACSKITTWLVEPVPGKSLYPFARDIFFEGQNCCLCPLHSHRQRTLRIEIQRSASEGIVGNSRWNVIHPFNFSLSICII